MGKGAGVKAMRRLRKRIRKLERRAYVEHSPAGFIWPEDFLVGLQAKDKRAKR